MVGLRRLRLDEYPVSAIREAIINAMVAADTMTGVNYLRSHAIPHDQLRSVLRKHGRLVGEEIR